MKNLIFAASAAVFVATPVFAADIVVGPTSVPDEQPPLIDVGSAPTGYGPDSWADSATGKVNWHARYNADGNYLTALFPSEAATLTINDIDEISYNAKSTGEHWFLKIYTRPSDGEYSSVGAGDQAAWFQHSFTNDYTTIASDGNWQEWSTNSGNFDLDNRNGQGSGTTFNDWATMKSLYGSELIEMISIQTDSGLGTAGSMDGLEIRLSGGAIGTVDFSAVPEPLTFLGGGSLLGILGMRRKRSLA